MATVNSLICFGGLNDFDYHDLVQTNGTAFKTVRGKVYGDTGATLKGVRVVQSDGTTSHADFSAGQRKPTAAEFRRFKRLVAAMQMGGLQFRERKGKKGGIEYWAVREPTIKKAA